MPLHIVYEKGVYRQRIVAAFEELEKAKEHARKECVDSDGYHNYCVGVLELNQPVEDLVVLGSWMKKWHVGSKGSELQLRWIEDENKVWP